MLRLIYLRPNLTRTDRWLPLIVPSVRRPGHRRTEQPTSCSYSIDTISSGSRFSAATRSRMKCCGKNSMAGLEARAINLYRVGQHHIVSSEMTAFDTLSGLSPFASPGVGKSPTLVTVFSDIRVSAGCGRSAVAGLCEVAGRDFQRENLGLQTCRQIADLSRTHRREVRSSNPLSSTSRLLKKCRVWL